MGNITTAVETITPERAAKLLESNTTNRTLSKKTVDKYADDMRGGNWELNGQSIGISEDGILEDGQHRLAACVEAGVSFQTVVVYGVAPTAFETIDSGRKRSVSDVLKIKGYKHYNVLAAVAGRILNGKERGLEYAFKGGRASFSHNRVLKLIEGDELIVPAAAFASSRYVGLQKLGISPAICGALFYAFAEASSCSTAEAFLNELLDIAAPVKRSPIAAAQSALIGYRSRAKGAAQGNAQTAWVSAIVIKAWNKWLLGEDARVLVFRSGGASPEKFPEIMRESETLFGGDAACSRP